MGSGEVGSGSRTSGYLGVRFRGQRRGCISRSMFVTCLVGNEFRLSVHIGSSTSKETERCKRGQEKKIKITNIRKLGDGDNRKITRNSMNCDKKWRFINFYETFSFIYYIQITILSQDLTSIYIRATSSMQ